ncbi:NAD(P)/FAD-dependent oxidoreductase [Panacagrimonas perspica]|nr:FAD/NAD(P)-binding oxidoreductase [Panacagrimonas perspica]
MMANGVDAPASNSSPSKTFHDVLIVGGGAAGTTVASLLKRRQPGLDIAVIEPSKDHWYQPAWTLVGAGAFDVEKTRRPTQSFIPRGVKWIQRRAIGFAPTENRVDLDDGSSVSYGSLVVALGIQLDWHKIEGLEATLGKNGVSSNYRADTAPYTWKCIREFQGGRALFTQPAMPIKCAGAPQKILYMAADRFKTRGLNADMSFFTPGAAIFGVPFYAKALDKVVASYGITPKFGHNLVAVDGLRRRATFDVTIDGKTTREDSGFDFLHVVPPQSAPEVLKGSPLADAAGWVSVDKQTLRHTQFSNVFGLGDCTNTPNSKTAAAVRAQAPVVAANLLSAREGSELQARYDGYASCPLTTSVGRIMLAEFAYDGVVTPSFPIDPRVPRRAYWWLKKSYLPSLYWQMLKGSLGPDWHAARTFPEAVPAIHP